MNNWALDIFGMLKGIFLLDVGRGPYGEVLIYANDASFRVYREEGDTEFIEEYSEVLLLNVVNTATKACQDSDKVKANGVRSLGNILRYLSAKSVSKLTHFSLTLKRVIGK